MSLAASRRLPEDERRAQILAAAARAFVRYGFHAATMGQVAEEAGMSAGNLYRYFPPRRLVEGLCEADQTERREAFAQMSAAPDLKSAMRSALKEGVVGCPPEKARMIVEIWAEAGRNARVREFARQFDREVIDGLVEGVELAKSRGIAAPSLDARFAARVIFTLVAGVFKRKALEPEFDEAAESAMVLGF